LFLPESYVVRYRAKRSRIQVSQERRREHRSALALITAIMCIPVLGTILAVVSTSKQELSDLVPTTNKLGGYAVLSWPELLRPDRHELNSVAARLDGAAVRVLGYMVEGDKPVHAGDVVQDFFVLPDAGNILDPADRFGDQMVNVRLRETDHIPFSPRQLVWVWGTFRASRGDPSGPTPLYHLESARVQTADRSDIGRYFQ
jgi:hypothetical protein